MSTQNVLVHQDFIKQRLPSWFIQASAEQRQRLTSSIAASHVSRARVAGLLADITQLEVFARPLLAKALNDEFGPGLDVDKDYFFHASFEREPLTGRFIPHGSARQSLLQAALHNFEKKEATRAGQESTSGIYRQVAGATDSVQVKSVSAKRFIELCRRLDLGGRYQAYLNSLLGPATGSVHGATGARAKTAFMARECDALHVQAHIAYMNNLICKAAHEMCLSIAPSATGHTLLGKPVELFSLTMLGINLRDIVVFQAKGEKSCTVYMPGYANSPLKAYGSFDAFMEELREQCRMPACRQYLEQRIPLRSKAAFFARLNDALNPYVTKKLPGSKGLITPKFKTREENEEANLRLKKVAISGGLADYFYFQQMLRIKDDARAVAVPTGDEDEKSRKERLAGYLELGMDLANLAAAFVPGLSEAMLVVSGSELLADIFEGFHAWADDEMGEALGHVLSVAQSVATVGLTARVGAFAEAAPTVPVQASSFVGKMIPVQLSSGETRLWRPDLRPFEADTQLPAGKQADSLGVFSHEDRHYIRLQGRYYPIEHDAALNKWRLRPPRHGGFAPGLESNGTGAWRHEGEQPLQWDTHTLFRRLTPSAAGLSDEVIDQIMMITATDSAQLLTLHTQNIPMPAELSDTLKRFGLSQSAPLAFEPLYLTSEATTNPLVHLLQRDFATLTTSAALEIIATADAAQIDRMQQTQRLPLEIAGRARLAVQRIRLNRAFESFFLPLSVSNPDTRTLALHMLENLPGWSDEVRIEIRDRHATGTLIDSIGPLMAAQPRILIQRGSAFQAFDSNGVSLHQADGVAGDLFSALLHAIPSELRNIIGFVDPAGDVEAFKRHITALATSDRVRAAKLLGQWQINPAFNLPTRLVDGRLGYLLSGRGRPLRPPDPRQLLLTRMATLFPEVPDISSHVQGLLLNESSVAELSASVQSRIADYETLRFRLHIWAEQFAGPSSLAQGERALQSRRTLASTLCRAWRYSHDDAPRGPAILLLESMDLAHVSDLPDLPEYYNQIRYLTLHDVTADTEQINSLLQHFNQVSRLAIIGGGLTTLPTGLSNLERLYSLSIQGQRLTIDQQAMDLLMGIAHLGSLNLSGNTLGVFSDTSRLHLNELMLNDTGLTQWPQWVDAMNLRELDISDNRITALPAAVVQNRLDPFRHTVIFAHRNPINLQDLRTYWLSAGYGRAYELEFDFPSAVRDLPRAADLGGGSSLDPFEQHSHSSALSFNVQRAIVPTSDIWKIDGLGELNSRLESAWQHIDEAGDAPHLLLLLQRLKEAADFRLSHEELSNDVLRVLEAAADDVRLRGQLEVMANDRLVGADQTCEDGARLIFSDIQVAVYAQTALKGVPAEQQTERLFEVIRAMFRLHEVQAIADLDIAVRESRGMPLDHAEVRMAYRVRLADYLALPGQPLRMVWERLANVSQQMILSARAQVLEKEAGPAFLEFAVRDRLWDARLRSEYAADIERATASVRAQMAALEERPPIDEGEYQRLRAALSVQLDAAEAARDQPAMARVIEEISALDAQPPVDRDQYDRVGKALIALKEAVEKTTLKQLTNVRRQAWY